MIRVLVPRASALLRDEHPSVEVPVQSGGSRSLLRMLRAHQVEFAIVAQEHGLEHDFTGLRAELLLSGRLRVAVPDGSWLTGLPSVTPDDLAKEPWIVGAGPAGDVQLGVWPGIDEPRIAYCAADWHARLGMVAAGLGIALVPESVASLLSRGITVLSVDDDVPHTRHVFAVTHRSTNPLAQVFLDALHEVAGPAAL